MLLNTMGARTHAILSRQSRARFKDQYLMLIIIISNNMTVAIMEEGEAHSEDITQDAARIPSTCLSASQPEGCEVWSSRLPCSLNCRYLLCGWLAGCLAPIIAAIMEYCYCATHSFVFTACIPAESSIGTISGRYLLQ